MVLQMKLKTSSSFRGIDESLKIVSNRTTICDPSPSHTTVLNWVHKHGLYQLEKEKPKANDWIIILDHSIQIGKEKVFTILGVRESEVDFTKPLEYQDLYPILEVSREKWDGNSVKEVIEKVQHELGRIKYAVADYGSDIKKGLEMAGISHVYDLTHKIAALLKKKYHKNEVFLSFLKEMASSRRQCQQTEVAHLIPPSMRTKSRFENIGAICGWANKMITYIGNIPKKDEIHKELIHEKFNWVLEYKNFISELFEINNALEKFQKVIKHNGISPSNRKKQISELKNLKTENGKWIKEKLIQYVEEMITLVKNRKTNILCSSDIIESAFGKYKNYVSKNPMAGITNLVLCIAAFTSPLKESDIIKSLEMYTINDVKKWTKENLKKSLYARRREAFAMS